MGEVLGGGESIISDRDDGNAGARVERDDMGGEPVGGMRGIGGELGDEGVWDREEEGDAGVGERADDGGVGVREADSGDAEGLDGGDNALQIGEILGVGNANWRSGVAGDWGGKEEEEEEEEVLGGGHVLLLLLLPGNGFCVYYSISWFWNESSCI